MRATAGRSVAETFAEAMHAFEAGQQAEARRLALRLAEAAPAFGGAHYLLGLIELERGHGRKAAGHLAQAIKITPGQVAPHLAMGRALEQGGDLAEACLHFRTVLDLAPGHAEAHARLGALLARLGKAEEAIDHCRRAVAASPDHAEAWNTLGGLLQQKGDNAEAVDCLQRALALRPDWPAALNNFGLALTALGCFAQAATILEGAVALRPDHSGSRVNLAASYRALGRLKDARRHAEKATRLDGRSGAAWTELGLVRQAEAHPAAAAAAFERAVATAPSDAAAWYCLAEARRAEGDAARAATAYGRCLALDPEDRHGAALGLALTGAAATPDRAPEAYVRRLFDDYATRFDETLVDRLDYCAPALLADALARILPRPTDLEVLDAGCGTGLAAPVLRPLARRLDGIDLSPAMVAKAAERRLYDHLAEGDLVAVLSERPARYDLMVAADVLVYLGDLDPVFRAARHALRPGGHLAFTVEKADDTNSYRLGPKHRYGHAAEYLRRLAEQNGFTVVVLEDAVTRRDGGADVPGLLAVLRAV
ncbi:tetratricopeptide repeat protein [Magnetospirillum sp. UT-4]|uniref:tetratricopeptide repeat protein n=1 Tax=Magnetospirillum sp. UT-4 TaxID=2681467 RepID=UPI00137D2783|nr:tetratricopeptide repeat protein [Magnetospirillum sp. UT-4]CAA7623385.1 Methyltransferase [Magnetospirillum sp. UT-4]